ncbi:hypothetical protein LXA43DRAFT_373286 [Ganoderma leucocontextum]|nr:hypothetical protein LXA43DRAFT_373286 [Ganoderma leucocontextum]
MARGDNRCEPHLEHLSPRGGHESKSSAACLTRFSTSHKAHGFARVRYICASSPSCPRIHRVTTPSSPFPPHHPHPISPKEMSLTDFMKAAFGIVFGYDLDAAGEPLRAPRAFPSLSLRFREVAACDEERKRPSGHARSTSPSMDYASRLDDMDCFGYPQPYFSVSGQVPSRTLVAWRARRSGVV